MTVSLQSSIQNTFFIYLLFLFLSLSLDEQGDAAAGQERIDHHHHHASLLTITSESQVHLLPPLPPLPRILPHSSTADMAGGQMGRHAGRRTHTHFTQIFEVYSKLETQWWTVMDRRTDWPQKGADKTCETESEGGRKRADKKKNRKWNRGEETTNLWTGSAGPHSRTEMTRE